MQELEQRRGVLLVAAQHQLGANSTVTSGLKMTPKQDGNSI